uniref:Uncharacterized protein n=1 Tax=Plectus sambesii TaxID=2011161 RepID=A0A914W953_9BILA
MNASSSEDEVFVGVATSAERKVRAVRERRQTETFTPNFRQRLRNAPMPAAVVLPSQAQQLSESPAPIGRLNFDTILSSPADSPPAIRPFSAKASKTFFSAPWLSDENCVPTSSRGKSELKRCAEELARKVSIQLHKPGRALRKRANPSANTVNDTLNQARQMLQQQEDELSGDNTKESSEDVADCLELLTSVNTAENAAFSPLVPTVTPQSTPISGKVRFRSSDDAPSSRLGKRKSPRIPTNLHKSILKANHAAFVAQMNAVSRKSAENMRPISASFIDSASPPPKSQTADQTAAAAAAAHSARMNAAFCFTAVRALSTSSSDSTSSSTSLATPTRFPNLLSRIMARRN